MQEENRETGVEKLIKWIVGIVIMALLPIVIPIATIVALFYYIPKAIGGWFYDLLKRLNNDRDLPTP